MNRSTIVSKPVRLADLSFDELYADNNYDWRAKAARLQNRRWRILSERIKQRQSKRFNRGREVSLVGDFKY